MSDKFQNQFRIESARAQWWNYGWNAAYFITICTAHREHYFGEIINGKPVETGQCPVSTNDATHATEPKTPGELRFRNQGKETLSSIVGSFKSVVTKYAHHIHADFEWQERFHDRIIRDTEEYCKIANYIENNVANWQNDKFYD